MLLSDSWFKMYVALPVLSLVTLFVFPIMLYWSKRMQVDWLYSRARSLGDATHIFIIGRGK